MAGWSEETVFNFLHSELVVLAEFGKAKELETENSLQETLEFLRRMVSQVPNQNSGSLLLKTPKVSRKNPVQRIETIHEDELVEFEVTRATSVVAETADIKVAENDNDNDDDYSSNRRSRRTASKKAASSIKQQQTSTLKIKLRRPSDSDEEDRKSSRKVQAKKEPATSSDEGDAEPVRQSRTRKASIRNKSRSRDAAPSLATEKNDKTFVLKADNGRETLVENKQRESTSKRKHDETKSPSPSPSRPVQESGSSRNNSGEPAAKKPNLNNEFSEQSGYDDTLESSIYEDAIGKPAPIHNSTKIGDTTLTIDQKMRASSKMSDPKSKEYGNNLKPIEEAKMNVTVTLETLPKYVKKAAVKDDTFEDEDLVGCTPEVKTLTKNTLQMECKPKATKRAKNNHKPNALFSPYATDSVKKRVEAFEQVGLNTPKSVEVDAPTRITRTKTRAMAAAEASSNSIQSVQPTQSISQKLARRSLAKAKKISLAKRIKEFDDVKENENSSGSAIKPSRLLANNEKLLQKLQLRITPIGKSRLQQPMSVNRLQHTPLSMQPLSSHSKAMSASRSNIIVSLDSFIPLKKETTSDKSEEKKRPANEEDARKKKEEALKAHMEEKKRKREEKERKNRLAREARDKLETEKRLKAEKEREEKAKIALQLQEKQREENEKKRQLQLQRAQEKEERRRQEEQLRLQRLQEQEEMERQYAEQKRKEQEAAEKQHQRRIAEAKAQQQALAEAAKMKAPYQTKTTKLLNSTHTLPKQTQPPTSYKIESEPDEDDASDNEEAPKHAVPSWATAEVRRKPLELQTYIKSYEVHRYFDSRQCTPDLTKIFEGIDKRRLKRTSSAIWKTPPRYSMMYNE